MNITRASIIQDIEWTSTIGSAHVAYFFFDVNDAGKQNARALLSSILVQLSSQSPYFCDAILEFYSAHKHGSEQPSDGALKQCLVKMLQAPREEKIYVILDALDECADTFRVQSSRQKILELIEELVGLHLPNLRLCITSRLEVDIQNVLEPLTSNRICLHDEDGQKKDIADYVSFVVNSDKTMMKWREKDKVSVIKTLSDRADGV